MVKFHSAINVVASVRLEPAKIRPEVVTVDVGRCTAIERQIGLAIAGHHTHSPLTVAQSGIDTEG